MAETVQIIDLEDIESIRVKCPKCKVTIEFFFGMNWKDAMRESGECPFCDGKDSDETKAKRTKFLALRESIKAHYGSVSFIVRSSVAKGTQAETVAV